MSVDGKKEPPHYNIPVGQGHKSNVCHASFTYPTSQDSTSQAAPVENQEDGMHIYYVTFTSPTSQDSMSQAAPVYTSGGGGVGSGLESGDGRRTFMSYDTALGRSPGMTTCTSCQLQVLTNVTYKAGTYAWVMCFLFIFLGLTMCLIPFCLFFFWKKTKDVYHTCPRCKRVLHVEKRQCCK